MNQFSISDLFLDVRDKRQIDIFVDQFVSCIDGKDAIYISGPITTGKQFVEWFNQKGRSLSENKALYAQQHRKDVMNSNLMAIKDFARKVRRNTHCIVVEPGSYENPEWSQDDYLYYWTSIISRFVKKIICMDGWHYSRGCVVEYLIGRHLQLEIVSQWQKPMDKSAARQLIEVAIAELSLISFDTTLHRNVYQKLLAL